MKYSLRSMMVVVTVMPPLVGIGWAAAKVAIDSRKPELVYPGEHPVHLVDWKAATEKVKLRAKRAP